jgi:hypothetical protein
MPAMKTIEAKLKRVIAVLIATSIIYVAFLNRFSLHLPSSAHAQFKSTAVRTAFAEENNKHTTMSRSFNTATSLPCCNLTLPPGNSTTTNTTNTTSAVSASEDTKDTWPEISNRLCPDMKPKFRLASTIFRLARQELIKGAASSLSNNASSAKLLASFQHHLEDCNGRQNQRLPPKFFSFDPHHMSSIASDGSYNKNKKEVFTYYPIWKCANNQLRGFWEQVFGSNPSTPLIKRGQKQGRTQGLKPDQRECIVVAIRDPISHFLSGYNEIETRIDEFRAARQRARQPV